MSIKDYKKFYTNEASVYHDTRYGGVYGNLFRTLHHETLSSFLSQHKSEERVLEVACGTGHTSSLLIEMGLKPVSCDLTIAMINKAKSRFSNSDKMPVFIETNAMNLPFEDNTFDTLISTRFLHLFNEQDQIKLFSEMHRVLKPGGELIIDFDNWSSRWILSIPYLFYNLIKYRRVAPYSIYNKINRTSKNIQEAGFSINKIDGVGGTHLILIAFLSKHMALRIGRLHKINPLRILSEQFVVSAYKK